MVLSAYLYPIFMNISWQPTAEMTTLHQRAELIKKIRHFFDTRGFLEVETPILSQYTVTDPFLASFSCDRFFLQTSPEYHMKRLLAAGSGPIFQISKAFRQDEISPRHNPEFTMLEWYRPGYDHHALMDEMADFLIWMLTEKPAERLSYQAIFEHYLGINPHTASLTDLQVCAHNHHIIFQDDTQDKDIWLDLLLSHCIEPHLGQAAPLFIYDYPASQAALAVIRESEGISIGERFEVYYQGIELANGFHELIDPVEQRKRFLNNINQRCALNLPVLSLDEYFLAALDNHFPPTAGVALGLDRLLMLILNKKNIREIMSFSIENA